MRILLPLAFTAAFLSAGPASACMAEPMPEAVLFDSPPGRPPPGYAVLRVVGSVVDQDRERLSVRIVEAGPPRRPGPVAWLEAQPMSSCTTWGRLNADAYVVVRVAGNLRGRTLLQARVYARSRWDYFWNWFGRESYSATGQAR